MLIRIIIMEILDDFFFLKELLLLFVVIELVFYIVNCSVFNVEEFRRENGIEVIWNDICIFKLVEVYRMILGNREFIKYKYS